MERIAGRLVAGVIRHLSLSIVASLPGLMIVVLIFLLTWLIIRLVKVVLDQVAAGRIQVPGIHPETVSATRRLISVVIWLFALSAAYPFLPGANSLAFKGISVFFGLMLTLGSTGVMTHAMSGLVLIYSRALRKGDWIRLADNEGQVSEIGVLATKILTRENYIVTVPNAVVVSGKIINLSAESADGGVNLTTSVTIGYDTPWRQVHALLELAARRTRGSISKLPRWCVSWDCSTGTPRMSCRCAYSPQPSCRMAATHCIAALLMCLTNSACRLCRRTL